MDCCSPSRQVNSETEFGCPRCRREGKTVKIITLKSLLVPDSLARLDPNSNYRMCNDADCPVVYFDEEGSVFQTTDIKVPVFQKSKGQDSPVCYCFGWTKSKLKSEIEQTGTSTAVSSISEHIKAGRCGCEVNNPQGSC